MTTTNAPPDVRAGLETVIGLEVHCQLGTVSKMFCRCRADYQDAPPNTHVCPVCQGLPGTLPVINRQAVEWTIKTGLALHMEIPSLSKFDRKNYPYPDLMKGYQITQFDMPFSQNGYLDVVANGEPSRIGITRVHLEEDTARLMHRTDQTGETYSLVDISRSGVPLMEIVSEPDMRNADEARAYLVALRQILRYLEVSTADMEKGSFRCDANISLRPFGSTTLGAKVEVKNMNSFRAVYKALQFEQARQADRLQRGERIVQETRGWIEGEEITVSQRTKEYAADYRYFPEPDLPPLQISRDWVDEIRASLPELPAARSARFREQYGLPEFDANLLIEDAEKATYYEAAVAALPEQAAEAQAPVVAHWMVGELARLMREHGGTIDAIKVRPGQLAALVGLIGAGTISTTQAKGVFETMYDSGRDPAEIVEQSGETQISDEGALRTTIETVLGEQPQAVADYRAGKASALKFLIGQIMKATRGRANPRAATTILTEMLEGADPPNGEPHDP